MAHLLQLGRPDATPRLPATAEAATFTSPSPTVRDRIRNRGHCPPGFTSECLWRIVDGTPFWATVGVERLSSYDDLCERIASPQESADVVELLVSAFYDDPTWSWAFPDPSKRAEQHRRLWGLFVEGAMRFPWYG